ncbi:hypothetical protein RhiirA4_478222 [Rhizophagus irregularis]|uniref:Uncharacterized protein n=1 Tax=Rhizophagus irregularis TaxID=588596 RepID=A0A2I1HEL9_9GLOM|nr:hypothetical protein RhiirA4_478222 [Rhizophagus irregularis]
MIDRQDIEIINTFANKNSNPLEVYNFINKLYIPSKTLNDWVLYSQISNLENDENIIIPSTPISIFIPFNNNEETCYYCKRKYSIKYCTLTLIENTSIVS